MKTHIYCYKSTILAIFQPFCQKWRNLFSDESLYFATRDASNNNQWDEYSQIKPAFGIICGWDIKPTKAESWLLRTNLRYSPVSMTVDNKKVAYDYIEFNFIQLVLFPERMMAQYKDRNK